MIIARTLSTTMRSSYRACLSFKPSCAMKSTSQRSLSMTATRRYPHTHHQINTSQVNHNHQHQSSTRQRLQSKLQAQYQAQHDSMMNTLTSNMYIHSPYVIKAFFSTQSNQSNQTNNSDDNNNNNNNNSNNYVVPRIRHRAVPIAQVLTNKKSVMQMKDKDTLADGTPIEEEEIPEEQIMYTWKWWRKHLITLGVCLLLSVQLGAVLTYSNDAGRLLGQEGELELHMKHLNTNNNDLLEGILDRLQKATGYNDNMKRALLNNDEWYARIEQLVTSGETVNIRNNAARVLDHMVALPDTQELFVKKGHHKAALLIMNNEHTSLYIRKAMASVLTQICSLESNQFTLVQDGIISALHSLQQNSMLHRQRTDFILHELSDRILSTSTVDQLAVIPENDLELLKTYRQQYQTLRDSWEYRIKSPLVKSGLILYAHTMFGGAVWGLVSSLYHKQSRGVMITNILRTSLVTGLIPAFFVGGVVSLFQHYQRISDDEPTVFRLYASTLFATVYPWYYILPRVERWAPLWLGGHIVGFMSFFIYMLAIDADLIKADQLLEAEDAKRKFQEAERERKMALLEARLLREMREKEAKESKESKPFRE